MAEIRLIKAATELNIGISNIVDFLNEKGFDIQNKPTTKITSEMYDLLVENFSDSKADKEEATKILKQRKDKREVPVLPSKDLKSKADEKVEPKEEVKTPEPIKVETPAEPVVETKAPQVVENTPAEVPAIETPAVEIPEVKTVGPKVVGKVDLTPKKKAPKVEETPKQEKPAAEKPIEEKPVQEIEKVVEKPIAEKIEAKPKKKPEPEPEPEEEPEKIETKFEKLVGTKVLSKIDLPVDKPKGVKSLAAEARDELKEKRKRKRREVIAEKVAVPDKPKEEVKKPFEKKPGFNKKPVSDRQVNNNVRKTQNNMGGAGKSRGMKQKLKNQRKESRYNERMQDMERQAAEDKILKVTEFLTANDLASLMDVSVNQVISTCFKVGIMVSINQRLDADVINLLADEFGFEVQFVDAEAQIENVDEFVDTETDIEERAPIVTVMGHVDHGKTSLLDYIRKTNVIAGEAGGITQHIGSHLVKLPDGRKITFLDTPGHEAFTAMRARGAKVTDIAIIVIAADDSIKPQTREAIAHAQAANVPMIFAINKIDKDGAKPEKVREELAAMNILVEDWGGNFQCQEISAKKGINIDELLEKVLLEAEMMELKANPKRPAKGAVIEARMEKGKGIVCDMLVLNGTLRVGDSMVAGAYYAKVRAMIDSLGNRIQEAGPSMPVKVQGFSDNPTAGDTFAVMEDGNAKELATKRAQLLREQGIRTTKHITLEEISRRLKVGNFKELKILVKGDVDGSVEALKDSLLKLSTEEISVNVIYSGVGAITESDVLLASASDAVIIGFQIRPTAQAKALAENEEIEIKSYSIIYKAIEEVKAAMEGMLSPDVIEKVTGNVEIRETFKISKVGTIAGCYVTDGNVARNSRIRVIRDGVVIHEGELSTLKRFKDDVKEVAKGYECGIQIKGYNDIEIGDYLEVYVEEMVKRTL